MVDPGLRWNANGGTNEASGRPASVLLVDDRPANLVALEATLAPLGVRTVSAVSGPEALRRCVWALGADGTPVYANRSWLEYAGADAGAQGPLAALHPEDEDAVRTDVQTALQRAEPIELEYRLRSARDGTYRWHAVR